MSNSGCQGLVGGENGKLIFNGYKFPGMKNENFLEIRCTELCFWLIILYCTIHLNFLTESYMRYVITVKTVNIREDGKDENYLVNSEISKSKEYLFCNKQCK